MNTLVCIKTATSADTSSSTYTFGGSNAFGAAIALDYNDTNGVADTCAGQWMDANSGNIQGPPVTTTAANDRLLTLLFVNGYNWASMPSDESQRVAPPMNANGLTIWAGDKFISSAGDVPAESAAPSGPGSQNAITLAIELQPGGPTPTPSATSTGATPTATATATATAVGTLSPTATGTASTGTATPTSVGTPVAVVASTPAVSGVNRIGLNTGLQIYYGEPDFMQNMFDNPGFEPSTQGHLITVESGATSSSFSDSHDANQPSFAQAAGFWNGAACSIRTGAAAGDTCTITTYTGGSYTFGSCFNAGGSPITCPTLATGVAVAEVLTSNAIKGNVAGGGDNGWYSGGDTDVALTTAQAYDGQGSLAMTVADGGSHYMAFNWDGATYSGGVCSNDNVTPCTIPDESLDCGGANTCNIAPQIPFHPVVGNFEIALYAMSQNTSGGTPQITVSLARTGGTRVSHTFSLTNDGNWHQYVYNFTGTDTSASAQNQLTFKMTATNNTAETGATIYVDDAYLGRAENSSTGFRDEFVQTLQAMNPGSLRYMLPNLLGTNYAQFMGQSHCTAGGGAPDTPGTCDFQKGTAGGTEDGEATWAYSPQDFYPLANQLKAIPWFSYPDSFSDADLLAFANNICSALTTYNFPAIYLEEGNEEWNGGGDVKYGSSNLGQNGYGGTAGRDFSIISAQASSQCPSYASRIHYVIGNQLCNAGVVGTALQGAANAGYPIPNTSQYGTDGGPYFSATGNTIANHAGSLSTQATQYAEDFFGYIPPVVEQGVSCQDEDFNFIGSNNFEAYYEMGPNGYYATGSSPSTEQGYLSQGGFPSAAWMASAWLYGEQRLRVPLQNQFTLTQDQFGIAPIWGIAHDLDSDFGPTFPHLRPIAMAMEVVNSAIGGAYYPVNAPSGTIINAFQNAGAWSAALVNKTSSPITLTMQFPSTGTLPQNAETVLNTNGISDNAENSNDVYVGALPGGLSTSGQNVTLTLPPFSVVAVH